jgi:hypothetical protein
MAFKAFHANKRRANLSPLDDPLEREADRLARRVMGMSAPVSGRAHASNAPRRDTGSAGHPLDPDTRAFFEPRFGHDFSNVRVHAGDRAAVSAQSIHAEAYTFGHDVVFAKHRYAPATTSGRWLLAHELAHVTQQDAMLAPAIRRKPQTGTVTDPFAEAVRNSSWFEAAELLNGFPYFTALFKVLALKPQQIVDVHRAGRLNPYLPQDSQALQLTRNALDAYVRTAVAQKQWAMVVTLLSAFDEDGVRARLSKLTAPQLKELYAATARAPSVHSKLELEAVVNTTLLKPATNTIDADFKKANEIYNPHDIRIKKGKHLDIEVKSTRALLGKNLSLDEFTTDKATTEELAVIKKNRTAGRITGYWVARMTEARGESLFKSEMKNVSADNESVIINVGERQPDTFAHELGHVFFNRGGHWNDAAAHKTDKTNLMSEGGDFRKTTGKGIDKLVDEQLQVMGKSSYLGGAVK